jgi:large repetitive protein
MIGSGVSMTAGRNVARALAIVLVTLAALVVGFSASALAAAPEIAITHPLTGSFTNDQAPSLVGTTTDTTDPITLKIYAGANVVEPPIQTLTELAPKEVSPGRGSWELTPEVALAQGKYTAVAEQTNVGEETGTSSAVIFTVDTTPPAVSINTLASPTEDPRPLLSGGAGVEAGDEASVGVVIFAGKAVGGTPVAEEVVAASEHGWSYAAPLLANGTYTAKAYQRDKAGNLGESAAMTFTVATKPPIVSINALPPVTNDPTPTITGTGGTGVGDGESVTVAIHNADKVVSSGIVPLEEGHWSYTPASRLADGAYTVQVTQSNESHEVGSDTETFAVDTTAPVVSIATPDNGSDLHVSRIMFSGHAGHAPGDDQLVTLKIFAGFSATGTPAEELELIPNGASEWSADLALNDGGYTVLVEQSDDAGNVGTATSRFLVETNSPTVTLDKSAFVARGSELVTGPTPSFSGTGGSEPEDSTTVMVKVYSGSAASGSPVRTVEGTLDGSTWTLGQVEALPDGTYTVQAEQADSSPFGQTGVSEPATFTVDADPPQVTLTSPTSGTTTSNGSQAVSGSAGTQEGDLPGIVVQLYAGSTATGSPLEAVTVQASGANWSAAFGALSPGTYTVRAQQSDDVGNVGYSEPATFTVTVAVPAGGQPSPVAPSASFKWIPAAPLTGESVTLVSTSTDDSSPITSYAWAPSGNGVFVPGETTLTTSFATPGAHVVQLRVTDEAGQSSTVVETIPVSAAPVPLMQPFPVVRMAGSYNATGAKITVLSVLAPVGAKVVITCRGPHCPTKSLAFLAAAGAKDKSGTVLIAFRRFERSLRGGVVLSIWVSKPGEIGKFTRFTIRRGKSPSRVDECLNPDGTTPLVCPS